MIALLQCDKHRWKGPGVSKMQTGVKPRALATKGHREASPHHTAEVPRGPRRGKVPWTYPLSTRWSPVMMAHRPNQTRGRERSGVTPFIRESHASVSCQAGTGKWVICWLICSYRFEIVSYRLCWNCILWIAYCLDRKVTHTIRN